MPRRQTGSIAKSPTGIQGLDEVTGGGLPSGRPTLVCGGPGCGKTLLAAQFLVNGAMKYGEPGVFMAFEETAEELTANVRSLGFDLDALARKKKVVVDFVRVERSEIEETGEYDLEGLFVRLGHVIDTLGARRVVLDTIETLFSGLSNTAILRAELRRLFRWLKEKGVTAVITGERGEGTLTRYGLEEYVSDCVILLDHRIVDQVSTRRLRIVKYRGTVHGTNEYPFMIDRGGINVLPITSLALDHTALNERVSSGVAKLDEMLGGRGYFRGSTVLVSGTAGTGKTSLAAHFVNAACKRGEKCLYIPFEESASQLARNMYSIGMRLEPWMKKGLLQVHPMRSTLQGLETHLTMFHRLVEETKPEVLVFDPIDSLMQAGTMKDASAMLTRLIDYLKTRHVTVLMTNLISGGAPVETSGIEISSLVDTWILLRAVELDGERNRAMSVIKSRGMSHSNQVREYLITDRGIELQRVFRGPGGVLTGWARQNAQDAERTEHTAQNVERPVKRARGLSRVGGKS